MTPGRLPFWIRRPFLLVRGARADRRRPPVAALSEIHDPVEFVWAILPYAARSFATSILMLPARHAPVAAVAYLYCRMLDTYEDVGDPDERRAALQAFAGRMESFAAPPSPPPLGGAKGEIDRLLIQRCHLVDALMLDFDPAHRERIVSLVRAMADGMVWSSDRFTDQGGVLVDEDQVARYCHTVIGEPVLFVLGLITGSEVRGQQRRDALAASELVQLANITRDIEQDLERRIGYHPVLRPVLGLAEAAGPVLTARRDLMRHALLQGPSYVRLATGLSKGLPRLARASAVLMLVHTDLHYRRHAPLVGHEAWPGPAGRWAIGATTIGAVLSGRWSRRVMDRIEREFLVAADALDRPTVEGASAAL